MLRMAAHRAQAAPGSTTCAWPAASRSTASATAGCCAKGPFKQTLDSAGGRRCRRRAGRRAADPPSRTCSSRARSTPGARCDEGSYLGPGVLARRDRDLSQRDRRRLHAAGDATRCRRVAGAAGRREDRRLVQRPHGVRSARARRPQHPRRPAQSAHAGADEPQDQVPRRVPAVRAGVLRERVADYFELDGDSPVHAAGGAGAEGAADSADRRAAPALGHRQAERAAVGHSGRHPHRLLGARADGDPRDQPRLLRPDQGVRATDRLPGRW